MKNQILIVVYGLLAMFLIALDAILWFKVIPHGFISLSAAIIFGVLGVLAAFLSFKCYWKEIHKISKSANGLKD